MTPRTLTLPAEAEIALPRGAGAVTVPVGKLPEEILQQLVLHGIRQKLADAYAGAKQIDPAVAQAVIEAWVEGRWARRGGGGGSSADPNATVRRAVVAAAQAFCRRHPKPGVKVTDRIAEAVKAWFDPENPKHGAVRTALGPAVRAILSAGEGDEAAI